MSILLPNADIIREWDSYTIENEPISSVDLMERAAGKCYEWLNENIRHNDGFKVVCGIGNNGGDGLVIARLLATSGKSVGVFIIGDTDSASEDFKINLTRLSHHSEIKPVNIHSIQDLVIDEKDIIIDAIFGTGLNRKLEGLASEIVRIINEKSNTVISIDMPSGLFADKHTDQGSDIMKASHTLSFQVPKLAFMMPENHSFVGDWHILDIGLKKDFPKLNSVRQLMSEKKDISSLIEKRAKFSHKGNFGHALLICGSKGKAGAALMSADAALRSGLGLLTVHLPSDCIDIMQIALPEAMVDIDVDSEVFTAVNDLNAFSACGIGPGIGTDLRTVKAVIDLLEKLKIPVVLDADAINALSMTEGSLNIMKPSSILTPHIKEFDRLAGKSENDFERIEKQVEMSRKYQIYILLKGAYSSLSTPEGDIWFNSTGNPGMACGGSGDVLTGLLTGLLAQRKSAFHSALIGMFVHGLAGDIAEQKFGEIGMKATDIIYSIPEAFKILSSR